MEIGPRSLFHIALYRDHWWCHEQVCLHVYAVRSPASYAPESDRLFPIYPRLSLKHVAAGGTLAEEVISTVRTAQALGTQRVLSVLYDKHIDQSRDVDMKAAVWHGGGLAIFFFVIYSAYALGEFSSKKHHYTCRVLTSGR